MTDKFENGEGLEMDDFFIRGTYMLMICGTYDSPEGARRETKAADFLEYGEWTPCTTPPETGGFYLLEGDYGNMDGVWPDSVLPAWWSPEYQEWECTDGGFNAPRKWMPVPWLPDVWEAAKQKNAADNARFTKAK